jgi:hypothetical protein
MLGSAGPGRLASERTDAPDLDSSGRRRRRRRRRPCRPCRRPRPCCRYPPMTGRQPDRRQNAKPVTAVAGDGTVPFQCVEPEFVSARWSRLASGDGDCAR